MSFTDFHLDTYNQQLPVNCQSTAAKKGSIFVPNVSQDISLVSKADIILAMKKKSHFRCCFHDKEKNTYVTTFHFEEKWIFVCNFAPVR